jgi:hypothetical protein
MKRVFTITLVADLVIASVLLHSEIKGFLWTHPWWHSFRVRICRIPFSWEMYTLTRRWKRLPNIVVRVF